MNPFMQSLPENAYFQSLPAWMRENILQAGPQFANQQDLESFVISALQKYF